MGVLVYKGNETLTVSGSATMTMAAFVGIIPPNSSSVISQAYFSKSEGETWQWNNSVISREMSADTMDALKAKWKPRRTGS